MSEIEYTSVVFPMEATEEFPLPAIQLLTMDDDGARYASKTIDVGDSWMNTVELALAQTQVLHAYGYRIDPNPQTWVCEENTVTFPIEKKEK